MKSLTILVSLGFLALLPFVANGSERVHWGYEEGPFGPENWADLSVDFDTCRSGEQQSPINLVGAVETHLKPIELHWKSSNWEVRNDGHSIVALPMDGGHVVINKVAYQLIEIQLHNPSEHRIDGHSFPMEAHFVHQAQTGEIAVIGQMIKGGGTNHLFDAFMGQAPARDKETAELSGFDPSGLVTDLTDIIRYQGSLTSPPCTENVAWTVLLDPLIVSDAALFAFNSIFPNNARPLQPLNRRYILTD